MSIQILGLLFALTTLQPGQASDDQENPQIELSMSIYPKEVAIGDTCYVMVTAKNHSDETAYSIFPDVNNDFQLTRDEKTWDGVFESLWDEGHTLRTSSPPRYSLPAGETCVCLAVPVQFPHLRELHKPFWDEQWEELKKHPEGLVFDFEIEFRVPALPIEFRGRKVSSGSRIRLKDQVVIKLRNDKEMRMIEDWYQKSMSKNAYYAIDKIWNCIHLGNRYPSHPNAPMTWQGWKKLEESITPSTMRDEIHLTRILIQYCDTKNKKVLDELKKFLVGMNEVQRTVLAKSIRDRARNICGEEIAPQFREIYKTIREYDKAPIQESVEIGLQNLGVRVPVKAEPKPLSESYWYVVFLTLPQFISPLQGLLSVGVIAICLGYCFYQIRVKQKMAKNHASE